MNTQKHMEWGGPEGAEKKGTAKKGEDPLRNRQRPSKIHPGDASFQVTKLLHSFLTGQIWQQIPMTLHDAGKIGTVPKIPAAWQIQIKT